MACLFPINLKNGSVVPCQKCLECRKRRISAWSFRLVQELKQSESAHFITLTYDTKHIPISDNGFATLAKRDLTLFFKRLRKAHGKRVSRGIKYYAVGEYGSKSSRPHYHIILFNSRVDLVQKVWSCTLSRAAGKGGEYLNEFPLCECGGYLGDVNYGDVRGVCEASVGYTLKYMAKPKKWRHDRDDRVKEFAVMSKGLGIGYLTEEMCNWHIADLPNRMYCNIADGKKIAMPRYYKDKLYYENERSLIADVGALNQQKEFEKWIESENFENELHSLKEYKEKSVELLLTYAFKGRNKI